MIVSFSNYDLEPRYDGTPWTQIQISESVNETGPWNIIDTINIVPTDSDPSNPAPRSFTTEHATLSEGWYLVKFLDALGNSQITDPVENTPAADTQLMASLDDVNANLDGEVIEATADNTRLIQVSVARVIRGFLSRVIDAVTLAGWASPDTTPEIIREVAGKLIASQLYYNATAKSSTELPTTHYSQILYNEAIAMLNQILEGDIILPPNVIVTPIESLTDLDFFPIDSTNRAFSMGMNL